MNIFGREDLQKVLAPLEFFLEPQPGIVAEDRENGKRVIIIDKSDETAGGHYIEAIDSTVAEANPEYPDDDPVFEVVFVESIPEEDRGYRIDLAARDLRRIGRKSYSFPKSRLKPVLPDKLHLDNFEVAGE